MIKSTKEAELTLKQEAPPLHHEKTKALPSSQWPRLKDPRIVRVSRAFGGKDRHSKVCTIRGLRDRRVRLSVPTAIQLYDLQDRLGLSQPSKVVDWLLNAAKHEIDELPPLPNIPSLSHFTLGNNNFQPATSLPNPNEQFTQNSVWKLSAKGKQVSGEISEEDKLAVRGGNQNNNPSFIGLVNAMMPFGGYQWDQNNSSSSGGDDHVHVSQFNNQTDNVHNNNNNNINVMPFPSNLSLSTGGNITNYSHNQHQILVCPPGATLHSYFPSSHVGVMDMDQRQINHHHYQMMSSGSQNLLANNSLNPSFGLAMMTHKPLRLENNNESTSQKDQDHFPSK